jgi:hypothetical protein
VAQPNRIAAIDALGAAFRTGALIAAVGVVALYHAHAGA